MNTKSLLRFHVSEEVFYARHEFLQDEDLLKEVVDQVVKTENIETFQKWLLEHLPNN